MTNLERMLEPLGLQTSDIPKNVKEKMNLYCNFGPTPIAELYKKDESHFTLRFGNALEPRSVVDQLPQGGIRVKPALLYRVQR